MKKKLSKNEMQFTTSIGSTCAKYEGTFIQNFSIQKARKCFNLWEKESYEDVILTKAYKLYDKYERKSSMLIGQGECIGLISYFSGKAYRGMGALGCSCSRTKGVGISTKENLMLTTLKEKGLANKIKKMRFKNLTANVYTLVCKVKQTIYNPDSEYENTHYELSIGLLGDDNSYVDLNTKWSTCLTEDFK